MPCVTPLTLPTFPAVVKKLCFIIQRLCVPLVQAPHGPSQTALILAAMAAADQPALSFVAAHGTGTPLGDPIETGALCKAASVLQQGTGSRELMQPQTITVGGVKTLLGHTEGTAGLAGLLLAIAAGTHGSAMPLRYRSLNSFVAASLDGNGHAACRLPVQVCSSRLLCTTLSPCRLAGSCCAGRGMHSGGWYGEHWANCCCAEHRLTSTPRRQCTQLFAMAYRRQAASRLAWERAPSA